MLYLLFFHFFVFAFFHIFILSFTPLLFNYFYFKNFYFNSSIFVIAITLLILVNYIHHSTGGGPLSSDLFSRNMDEKYILGKFFGKNWILVRSFGPLVPRDSPKSGCPLSILEKMKIWDIYGILTPLLGNKYGTIWDILGCIEIFPFEFQGFQGRF